MKLIRWGSSRPLRAQAKNRDRRPTGRGGCSSSTWASLYIRTTKNATFKDNKVVNDIGTYCTVVYEVVASEVFPRYWFSWTLPFFSNHRLLKRPLRSSTTRRITLILEPNAVRRRSRVLAIRRQFRFPPLAQKGKPSMSRRVTSRTYRHWPVMALIINNFDSNRVCGYPKGDTGSRGRQMLFNYTNSFYCTRMRTWFTPHLLSIRSISFVYVLAISAWYSLNFRWTLGGLDNSLN